MFYDTIEMAAQSFWGAVRRFLTPRFKKTRDWKRICLIVSFCAAAASFIGLEASILIELNEVSYTWKSFAFADEFHELVHSNSTIFIGASVSLFVLVIVQAAYFYLIWPGYDRTILRTCAILVFVPVNLALAWIQSTSLEGIFSAQIDPSKSAHHPAGITNEKIQERYDHLARGMRRIRWFSPVVSIFLTLVQCGTVAFWLWLLPSRNRLPNRYEPVITAKGHFWTAKRAPESIELSIIPTPESAGHLEAIFREHENARVHNILTSGAAPPSATRRRRAGRSLRAPQRSGTGPELAPEARYWLLSNAEDGLKGWVIGMAIFIIFGFGFELPTYAILRENKLRCPWHCHVKVYHPVVFTVWLTAFMLLLVYRVPLDYRLLKSIRVDILLLVTLCMCWAFWLVVHVPRYTYPNQAERNYIASLKDTPLQHLYEVANILQTTETALGTMLGFGLVGLIVYWLYGDLSGRLYFI
ncbi:hypothetical protein F5B22DRAFT_80298 [Xylaria bambusicola]|uniref:uncharacterized protein n=1 Tax=Xylaria bambusicola TaxID=326684 RepID=UPI002008D411|nr:uncharacterized protein F5B22DRAFT_80298 [Xylaria bambusicola]KAI0518301.1 hypothetical protein F5B22DRAFT_80298 [Xylaria bambusicola]